MGVRGLTTYINYNQDKFLQDHLLYETNLVIDGYSLCSQLYRLMKGFSAFGGDYDKLFIYIKNFFKNLKKCNISSYVIFDGTYENRKLKTAFSRLKSKIYGASKLDPVTQSSLQIFPLLLRDVFKEVLMDMNIPYTVCEFEADDEIAAMARHLDCPVLSYDSDFFIFNVQYIPFNTLDFKPKPYEVDNTKINVLECKIFKVEQMMKNFGGLKAEMLPLVATLLGNDYVQKKSFNKFFSQLKLPKMKKKKNDQQRSIHGLFKWLQNETLDSAILKIIGQVKKNKKRRIQWIIRKSIEGYHKTHCRSLKFFGLEEENFDEVSNLPESVLKLVEDLEIDEDKSESDDNEIDDNSSEENNDGNLDGDVEEDDESNVEEDTIDSTPDNTISGLPLWYADLIRMGFMPWPYLNLYKHHMYFCSPQAEDYKDEDSFICTLPILRYAFDILTDYSQEYCIYVSRENDLTYKRISVNQELATPPLNDKPFQELTVDELHLSFNHFLKHNLPLLDLPVLDLLPLNFQLTMVAILWWIKKSRVPISHVHSLFICYIMLDCIDERTGTFRGHNHFNNKFSTKLQEYKKRCLVNVEDNDLFLNKHKVQYEDCMIAAGVMLKHFEIDDSILKRPKTYNAQSMQIFAQFQNCLLQFNSLNTLCRCPLESTKYYKTLNGTFAYNIALKLENQTDPVQFFEQYLRGAPTVIRYYKSLCKVFHMFVEKMNLVVTKKEGTRRKCRHRKKKAEKDELYFLIKEFESSVLI